MDYNTLERLSNRIGNSFYALNEKNYLDNIKDLRVAFEKLYPKIIIGYSFKTNYIPRLCQIAKENDVYAEVVSDMELELALKLGYSFDQIIFNGPYKRLEDLERTILNGSIVNLDSELEVQYLEEIRKAHPQKKIAVGLRINMSLVGDDGKSVIQEGLKIGRFGFDCYGEEFAKVIDRLRSMNITIYALHGHTSSSDRSLRNFETIATTLCQVRDTFQLNDIQYFNVGGGFFGPMPKGFLNRETPSFDDYASTIVTTLKRNSWFNKNSPHIILEPGVSVVSNSLSYIAKVLDVKKIKDKRFALIEGGVYNVKPTMHSYNLPHSIVHKPETQSSELNEIYDIVGTTCMEKDVVLKDVSIKNLKSNDFIKIDNIGAYTVVKTPNFINFIPAIISIKNDSTIEVIRDKQDINSLLTNYKINDYA
ncbi:type III PLP-dependent enzyme domain-containing protein [Spongiivirga citrea]|uniref:Diaminopimelate decarboxylase n=1 Tax=Spongiivirga citrea TaxID=1481457 RepID=A0A6M0CN13_9FLAO|nr:diaminopimelate decarboxylase [Spongiivirga citrea]NER16877.1 diaminopimelate decarboxylase [Spongiivirga citrea]